jgi:hypothetical protein
MPIKARQRERGQGAFVFLEVGKEGLPPLFVDYRGSTFPVAL